MTDHFDPANVNDIIDEIEECIADIEELILLLPISSDDKNIAYDRIQDLADLLSDAVELVE